MSVHIFRVVYVCIVSMYVSYFFITPASQEGESFHPAGEHCIFDQIDLAIVQLEKQASGSLRQEWTLGLAWQMSNMKN